MDDNQSSFRTGRSAADATQILVRIPEDSDDLKNRREIWNLPQSEPTDPEARLLDLSKEYPRVNKRALWEILRNCGIKGPFIDSLVESHEATSKQTKGEEGKSEEWNPERILGEGCSPYPCLFNINHQLVMRIDEAERKMSLDTG